MLAPIDKKLFRDIRRLAVQLFAVSLVVACAVSVMILANSAHHSLVYTSEKYYEQHRFADVFVSLRKAPMHVANRIASLESVDAVEPRILEAALIDVQGMQEPATGVAISIPDTGEPDLNQLYLRKGRMPKRYGQAEVLLLESFAHAHHLEPGDFITAIINGRRRDLLIAGIVLSPEFVFTIGPGDMVPDARRFGVFYARESLMANWFDSNGAFNDLLVRHSRSSDIQGVIIDIDDILRPYGGSGAILRKDQLSNAFLQSELTQLQAMSSVIPPVFLIVSIFLVHMILSRLVELEREQIGLLKALGYSNITTSMIYVKLVLVVCAVGCVVGTVFGTWAGKELTVLFSRFYTFPDLIYTYNPRVYLLSYVAAFVAGTVGAITAARKTMKLTPQVAMSPPAPGRYDSRFSRLATTIINSSPRLAMTVRHLLHSPWRALTTIFGTSVSVALLVVALFVEDSVDHMIDTLFFKNFRFDAALIFDSAIENSTVKAVERWPGVLRAEPYRETRATFINGHRELKSSIVGISENAEFRRVLDRDDQPYTIHEGSLLMNSHVARKLNLNQGDAVTIELTEIDDRQVTLPISGFVNEYIGTSAYVSIGTLNSLLNETSKVSGVYLALDEQFETDIYQTIKNTPHIPAIALSNVSLREFRHTMDQNILITAAIYTALAVVITFGVVYNTARIQLSERSRELASLRIFGFSRPEVFQLFIGEIVVFLVLAQPVGWLLGLLFSYWVTAGFSSDLFRIPLVIDRSTYAIASLISIAAAVFSLISVQQRVGNLDLVRHRRWAGAAPRSRAPPWPRSRRPPRTTARRDGKDHHGQGQAGLPIGKEAHSEPHIAGIREDHGRLVSRDRQLSGPQKAPEQAPHQDVGRKSGNRDLGKRLRLDLGLCQNRKHQTWHGEVDAHARDKRHVIGHARARPDIADRCQKKDRRGDFNNLQQHSRLFGQLV